ncbi:hypothetical protein OTU49_000726 [Cherax quadricarinatus]|uniref:C-type lectin domain-containing protein n=1 Tax=Cherax quadricarinatus TaxID=27406 RepID=A0AAW0Y294_CHEQU|nr:secretory phospholipase A2 receptor-like isoform X1 [Cherax quadricarinatus]
MRLERGLLLRLLLTAVLAFTAADEDDADHRIPLDTISSGIHKISAILEGRRDSCKKKLSQPVETRVSELEKLVARQWEGLQEVEQEVKAMEDKMSVLLQYRGSADPTPAHQGCVEPFEIAAGGCFWAHKDPSLSWKQARKRCQQEGGDLATPEDLTAARHYLRRKLGSDFWYVWLGGTITGPRKWTWLDGRELESSEDHWAATPESGDCLALNGGRGYRAMEWDCESENWFLCEKKLG